MKRAMCSAIGLLIVFFSTLACAQAVYEPMSFAQAQAQLQQKSPKLAGQKAALEASRLQEKAVQSISHPIVFARAGASKHRFQRDIDLSEFKSGLSSKLSQAQGLPPQIAYLGQQMVSGMKDEYALDSKDDSVTVGVGIMWPIYTGGRTTAIKNLLKAKATESEADVQISQLDMQTLLVVRYFDAQLAQLANELRQEALSTVKEVHRTAKRLYEEGFISLVEKMEAEAALADAQIEAQKADNNAQLANMALQRLLRTEQAIKPSTALFMTKDPIQPLAYFQENAMKNHPGLAKVDAKLKQAQQLKNLSAQRYKPNVSLFGYASQEDKPSWMVGVSATWQLTGGLNPTYMRAANDAKASQARYASAELKDNLNLLVEKYWHDVTNAQARYAALQHNVDLSKKVLELRQIGLKQGVNTTLDVVKAQTQQLKSYTEQAQAANDYVKALAHLLQASGTPEKFNDYMQNATVRLQ